MASGKYIGYIGGAAVAAGVGAAIAVAGQGTAMADTGDSTPSSSESKTAESPSTQNSTGKETGDKAGPKRPLAKIAAGITKDLPKANSFDQAGVVKNLQKKFSTSNPPKTVKPVKGEDTKKPTVKDIKKPVDTDPVETTTPVDIKDSVEEITESAAGGHTPFRPLADLTAKASEAAATLTKTLSSLTPPVTKTDTDTDTEVDFEPTAAVERALTAAGSWYVPNDAPVPWSWNPFREGDPIPNDMPQLVWQLEQGTVGLFDPVPFVQPAVREGFEFGYRVSQVIPWVNVVVPLTNIAGDIPDLISGDPVLFRDATQSIINNLLVTTQPVAILFYGYDQIADVFNVEYEAQQLKVGFYRVTWDVLDFFGLLHNKGQSGLPLSSNPAGGGSSLLDDGGPVMYAAAVTPQVTASTDDPLSNPFRPDDPDPKGMPAPVLQLRNAILAPLPAEIQPYVREGFELAYRGSQMVPYVNAVIPITEILPALVLAASGDKDGAQVVINQLLITTGPLSVVYYGYDAAADLLNVEDGAWELKNQIYATAWDTIDFANLLHNPGNSGLETVTV